MLELELETDTRLIKHVKSYISAVNIHLLNCLVDGTVHLLAL